MGLESYTGAVAELLDCDVSYDSYRAENWVNYPERFGFTEADSPELIRMACDPLFDQLDAETNKAAWAPLHAVRALGQLQAEEAIAPLLKLLLQDDDYFKQNIPEAIGLIGERAIPSAAQYVNNSRYNSQDRIFFNACLEAIAVKHPEHHHSCIKPLVAELANYESREDDFLDACLIDTLAELRATEAASLIETVFSYKEIDETIASSWPMVQVRLGLKQEADFTPKQLKPRISERVKAARRYLALKELPQFSSAPSASVEGFGAAKKTSKKKKKR
ncbi:MAG: hypothetical protein WBA10_10485 [Elainellaceae cyanobacterium]